MSGLDEKCYVEIPADKLHDALKLAYELSSPQGLGFLHYQVGGLDDAIVSEIIERERPAGHVAASMDYVNGRSCKFTVFRGGEYGNHNDKLFVRPRWYDHSDHQLEELLTALGIDDPAGKMAAAVSALEEENAKWERENARQEQQ